MPEARSRRTSKRASSSRRETATEKAARLETELAALKSTVKEIYEEAVDSGWGCEEGVENAGVKLARLGVAVTLSPRDVQLDIRVNVKLSSASMLDDCALTAEMDAMVCDQVKDTLTGLKDSQGGEVVSVDYVELEDVYPND